jgi:hypothetical protein
MRRRRLLACFVVATIAIGILLGTCIGSAHATSAWILRAADRIPLREHRHADHCGACLRGNGHRFNARRKTGGYKGPYQFGYAWVAEDIKHHRSIACVHGLNDWRACYPCARARFIRGAEKGGKRWVRRHWGQTCGRL